jgi:hypothetical protein
MSNFSYHEKYGNKELLMTSKKLSGKVAQTQFSIVVVAK